MISFFAPQKNRLDKLIFEFIKSQNVSRARVQDDITNGNVLVDGTTVTKSSFLVAEGQKIDYAFTETSVPTHTSSIPEDIDIEILFENDEMLVVNKPAGMPTHPDEHYHSGTLVNAVMGYLQKNNKPSLPNRAGIVHRLDKDTSGCLMVAKTEKMHLYLSTLIAERKITKKYTAVVVGNIPVEKGTIDAPLARDPHHREKMIPMDTKTAKSAITHFDVLERYANPSLSLLSVHIVTGRTHQIRAHFRAIGFPVIHDALYGNGIDYGCGRMFLHASFLQFALPNGTMQTIQCALPFDLENFLEKARLQM